MMRLHVPVRGTPCVHRRYNPRIVRIVAEMTDGGANVRDIADHLQPLVADPVNENTVWTIRKKYRLRIGGSAFHVFDEVVVERLVGGIPVGVRRRVGHRLAPELVEAIRILRGYGMSSRQIHARLGAHITLHGLRRWMARHREELKAAA